jgi:dTDP-glucose 4,6-dehydratase
MMMDITSVVAGGAGFLGSHLCERLLLKEGHNVICVDNLVSGDEDNIAHLKDNSKFKFVFQDISEPLSKWSYLIRDCSLRFIWNFASLASPVDYLEYPISTLSVGSAGVFNLLDLADNKGARFLQASTSEVYGDPLVHPQVETYWGNVNPIGLRSVYDESKRFAEALVAAHQRQGYVDTRIARIFNTYGERMRAHDGRAIPEFISRALKDEDIPVFGDGFQTRSLCYVSDLINGIVKLMMFDYSGPVNIGNPDEITMLQLAEEIIQLTGSKSKIVFKPLPEDDPKVRKPDISLAKSILNWEPQIDRREGLKRTISYFKTK